MVCGVCGLGRWYGLVEACGGVCMSVSQYGLYRYIIRVVYMGIFDYLKSVGNGKIKKTGPADSKTQILTHPPTLIFCGLNIA